jgi:hypothetical protein
MDGAPIPPRGPKNTIMLNLPFLGHGIGLRSPHFARVLDGTARADWFEVISENYMIRGGRPRRILEKAPGLLQLFCTEFRWTWAAQTRCARTISRSSIR